MNPYPFILKDKYPDKQLFSASVGFLGKHPVSDREAVVEELKAQGKWQEENQTKNETNSMGKWIKQPANSNLTSYPENASFAGILWIIASFLRAFVCIKNTSR